jgi:hypothetical protein
MHLLWPPVVAWCAADTAICAVVIAPVFHSVLECLPVPFELTRGI